MAVRKLYALFDHDTKIGEYTSREIADILKTHPQIASCYACTGMLYKGRYSFVIVGEESGKTRKEPLLKEWMRLGCAY